MRNSVTEMICWGLNDSSMRQKGWRDETKDGQGRGPDPLRSGEAAKDFRQRKAASGGSEEGRFERGPFRRLWPCVREDLLRDWLRVVVRHRKAVHSGTVVK